MTLPHAGPPSLEALLAHRTWVRTVARRLARDEFAADDLEQDAWLAAARNAPSPGPGIKAWFARVLKNRSRELHRSAQRAEARERSTARPEARPAAGSLVAEAEAHRRVVDSVLALPEPLRETVLLRFFEGLPPRDVAARLGVPVATARTRLRRAAELLRDRLGGDDEGAAWLGALTPLLSAQVPSTVPLLHVAGGAAMKLSTKSLVLSSMLLAGVGGGVVAIVAVSSEEAPSVDPPAASTARVRSSVDDDVAASRPPANDARGDEAAPVEVRQPAPARTDPPTPPKPMETKTPAPPPAVSAAPVATVAAVAEKKVVDSSGHEMLRKELAEKKLFYYHDLSYVIDPTKLNESRWEFSDGTGEELQGVQFSASWIPNSGQPPGMVFKVQKFPHFLFEADGKHTFTLPFKSWGQSVSTTKVDDMAKGFYEDWIRECTEFDKKKSTPTKKRQFGPSMYYASAVGLDKERKQRVRKIWYAWVRASASIPATYIAEVTVAEKFIDEDSVVERAETMMKLTSENKDKRAKIPEGVK